MFKRILPTVAALLAAGAIALAANNTFVTAIGDLIFPFTPPTNAGASGGVSGTIGNAGGQGMAPLNGSQSYAKVVPSTGFTATFGNFQQELLLKPAGTLLAGYINLAPAPVDGGKACIFTTATITNLYIAAGAGATLADAVTTLTANGRVCYLYSLSNATWNRMQ